MTVRTAAVWAALTLVLAAAVLAGCAVAPEDSPEAAVTGLLELRSLNSTDPVAYASYVTTPVAEALAQDSATRDEGSAPLPGWGKPQVTSSTTSTAEVRVEWRRSEEHTGWPAATTFKLERTGDAWLIVDAVDEAAQDGTQSD